MDLRQLEMFLAIVEEGGFNKAAAELHVSQSAISRKISLLEKELDEPLFLRVCNRVIITPAGEALLRHTRVIFRQLKEAATEVYEIRQLLRGEVAIGAGMTACTYLLPPILRDFRQRFSKVEVKITTGSTLEILPQIKDGGVDLGILTLPIVDENLIVRPYLTEELVVTVGIGHPWAKRKLIEAKELSGMPFSMYPKPSNMRHIVDEMFRECRVAPQIVMELDNFAIIKPLVEINLCVSILPLSSVVEEVNNNQLHILRIKGRKLQRRLAIVHLKTNYLPRAVNALIKLFGHSSEVHPNHQAESLKKSP